MNMRKFREIFYRKGDVINVNGIDETWVYSWWQIPFYRIIKVFQDKFKFHDYIFNECNRHGTCCATAIVKDPITICADCKHFICNSFLWYDQLCGNKKTQDPKKINPVTGGDAPLPFARNVNKGDCKYFEKRDDL